MRLAVFKLILPQFPLKNVTGESFVIYLNQTLPEPKQHLQCLTARHYIFSFPVHTTISFIYSNTALFTKAILKFYIYQEKTKKSDNVILPLIFYLAEDVFVVLINKCQRNISFSLESRCCLLPYFGKYFLEIPKGCK